MKNTMLIKKEAIGIFNIAGEFVCYDYTNEVFNGKYEGKIVLYDGNHCIGRVDSDILYTIIECFCYRPNMLDILVERDGKVCLYDDAAKYDSDDIAKCIKKISESEYEFDFGAKLIVDINGNIYNPNDISRSCMKFSS